MAWHVTRTNCCYNCIVHKYFKEKLRSAAKVSTEQKQIRSGKGGSEGAILWIVAITNIAHHVVKDKIRFILRQRVDRFWMTNMEHHVTVEDFSVTVVIYNPRPNISQFSCRYILYSINSLVINVCKLISVTDFKEKECSVSFILLNTSFKNCSRVWRY